MKKERPLLVAMDLEGVLVPEVWIAVAERTGIEELRLTTRDISDYDVLMRKRLGLLQEHGLKLADIQEVIAGMSPMPGAMDYLSWLRSEFQTVILSDTFYEFAKPLMQQLGWPTLFCNSLVTDDKGDVRDYSLRLLDGKRHAVLGFKQLNFTVIAMGDSYNDTSMLAEADLGILFRPSVNVKNEFPQFQVAEDYECVKEIIKAFAKS